MVSREHRYRNNWYSDFWYYICFWRHSLHRLQVLSSSPSVLGAMKKFGGDPAENTRKTILLRWRNRDSSPYIAEQPTGTINVSGQVIERRKFDFVGSGIIYSIGFCTEEHILHRLEDTILFGIWNCEFESNHQRSILWCSCILWCFQPTNNSLEIHQEETILFVANGDGPYNQSKR